MIRPLLFLASLLAAAPAIAQAKPPLVLAAAIFGMVNYVSFRNYARHDFSRTKLYQLSDKTTGLLKSLTNSIEVTVLPLVNTSPAMPSLGFTARLCRTSSQPRVEVKISASWASS